MKRVLAAVAAAFLILCAPAAIAPANASGGVPDHCKITNGPGYAGVDGAGVNLKVCWNDMNGGGIRIVTIQETVDPSSFWESTAFKCDWLVVWTDSGNNKWESDNPSCNIPKNLGYRVYEGLTIDMPNAAYATVTLAGWPQINDWPDPGYTKITVKVSCPC